MAVGTPRRARYTVCSSICRDDHPGVRCFQRVVEHIAEQHSRAIRLLARKTTEFSSDGLARGSTQRTTTTRTRASLMKFMNKSVYVPDHGRGGDPAEGLNVLIDFDVFFTNPLVCV